MPRFRRINNRERRAFRRMPASAAIPQEITRLATGQEVRLVNIALNGSILIHSKTMLSPGTSVRLKLSIPGTTMNLEGRVHRCRVIGLKQARIQYEAAILFEGELPEPLAGILQRLNDEDASSEASASADTEVIILPETAQLWILNASGAEMPA